MEGWPYFFPPMRSGEVARRVFLRRDGGGVGRYAFPTAGTAAWARRAA